MIIKKHWAVFTFVVLLLGSLSIQALGAWQDSPTRDEPSHIDDGLAYWQLGTFEFNYPHPPLAKLLPGLAAYIQGVRIDTSGSAWAKGNTKQLKLPILYENRTWRELQRIVFGTRLPMLLFSALLAITVFIYTRQRFGDLPALTASTILMYDPSLVGHGYLVNTDVPVTAMIFLLAVLIDRFFQKPNTRNLIWLAVIFGLTLLTKFSAIYLWPIMFVLLVWKAITDKAFGWPKLWRSGLTIFLITVALFFVVYRFEGLVPNTSPFKTWTRTFFGKTFTPIPPSYWRGLQYNIDHNAFGHRTIFRQEVIQKGHPLYFPLALITKTPLPTLLLWLSAIATGLVFLLRRPRINRLRLAVFLIIPLVYAAVAIKSQLNIGIRHIFPIYPFLALLVGWMVYRFSQWRKYLAWGAFALAVSVIPITLAAYPATISYFNTAAGGSQNGWRWFVDSNTDWGQDAWRIGEYLEKHPGGTVGATNFTPVPLASWAPGATPVLTNKPAATSQPPDRIIISDAFLRAPDRGYDWLWKISRDLKPERLGSTVTIFHFK